MNKKDIILNYALLNYVQTVKPHGKELNEYYAKAKDYLKLEFTKNRLTQMIKLEYTKLVPWTTTKNKSTFRYWKEENE